MAITASSGSMTSPLPEMMKDDCRSATQQQRFEAPQRAVRAPVLGELDRGAREVAVLLQLALEALEQREGIRGAAGKSREHLVVVQAAHFAGIALHDGVADRDLAVAAHGHGAVAAHREDRRAVRVESGIAHGISYLRLLARGWDSS